MTFEELKNKFEELTQVSLNLKDTGNYMILKESGTELLAFNKHSGYERHLHINTISIHRLLNLYDEDNYKKMWEIIFNLVDTPADERFLEQKYYVKPDLPDFINTRHIYLNRNTYTWGYPETDYTLDTPFQTSDHQTQFTMEEIEEIIPKEDMEKFQLIPVEEDKINDL